MWKIIELVFISAVFLIVLTQVLVPSLMNIPYWWMFKKDPLKRQLEFQERLRKTKAAKDALTKETEENLKKAQSQKEQINNL